MTDKVQKIREAVEKLKSQLLRGACSSQVAMETRCKEEAYNEVLAILDTMIEGKEPVSRTPADIEAAMQELEEKIKAFTDAHQGENPDTILAQMRGEEPVREDKIEKKFKAGDVVMYISSHSAYSGLYLLGNSNDLHIGYSNADEPYNIALRNCTIASEDERSQFMRELANNGYRWDKKTKRIEKIEPVSEDLGKCTRKIILEGTNFNKSWYAHPELAFKAGAEWQKKQDQETIEFAEEHAMLAGMENMKEQMMANIWKPANGDDLPEIDREVIALIDNGKVVFAHRPNPDGWDGKSIATGKIEHYTPKTYDKGGWNIPNVKYWLDCSMTKEIER